MKDKIRPATLDLPLSQKGLVIGRMTKESSTVAIIQNAGIATWLCERFGPRRPTALDFKNADYKGWCLIGRFHRDNRNRNKTWSPKGYRLMLPPGQEAEALLFKLTWGEQ